MGQFNKPTFYLKDLRHCFLKSVKNQSPGPYSASTFAIAFVGGFSLH